MINLTREDGVRTTNTIFLEPEVFAALIDFVRSSGDAHEQRTIVLMEIEPPMLS
jgi:hypothetical protein